MTQLEDSMNNGSAPTADTAVSSSSDTGASGLDTNSVKNDMLLFRILQAMQAYTYNNYGHNNNVASSASSLSTTA